MTSRQRSDVLMSIWITLNSFATLSTIVHFLFHLLLCHSLAPPLAAAAGCRAAVCFSFLAGRISVSFYPEELREKTNSDLLHFLSFIRPFRCAPLYPHRPLARYRGQQSPPLVQLDDTHLQLAWLSRSSLQLPYMGEDGEGEGRSL